MTAHLRIHVEGLGMIPGVYPRPFQFPGGEWHLDSLPEHPEEWHHKRITYIADIRGASMEDIIKASLWADVAYRLNFSATARSDARFVLMCPYLPAARADRGVPKGSGVYSRILKAMVPARIIGMDPHSPEITHDLIPYYRQADHLGLLEQAVEGIEFDGIICPDNGAMRRCDHAATRLGKDVYYADKQRDFATGKLSGFKAPLNLPRTGKYLVVDDICDGGGTFMGLAEATGLSRDQLGLWVTHGIFSGKADRLREKYRWIATTDSHPGSNRIDVATCIVPCFKPMFERL